MNNRISQMYGKFRRRMPGVKYKLKVFKADLGTTLMFATNDFRKRYSGSLLGVVWAFILPIVTTVVYWIVFQYGLHAVPVANVPFLIWFLPGIVPWFLFSDIIMGSINVLFEYSYIVKKVVFKTRILPLMKAFTAAFVHMFFIVLVIVINLGYGRGITIYYLQLPYYFLCAFALALAVSYISCAVVVFFKDFGQVINIVLMLGMWITPIVWPINIVSEKYRWIFQLNPAMYFVQGYRDSFVDQIWFWHRMDYSVYFWVITGALIVLSQKLFNRLKAHFADML